MARLVYKGKINGNDVIYKEKCLHGCFDRLEGQFLQNIMEVVTENGKKFRFRAYDSQAFIKKLLEENENYQQDFINEVVIKVKGKKKLSYNARSINHNTVKGMRINSIFEKANALYNEIRQEIMGELKEQYPPKEKPKPKPKPKKLEQLALSEEEKDKIAEEASELFYTGTKIDACVYKNNPKQFIRLFSKIEDKNKKTELLNAILKCDYENKEVIEWLNKNETDLLREAGFNS